MRRPLVPLALIALLAALAPTAVARVPLDAAVARAVAQSPVGDRASIAIRDANGTIIAAVRPTASVLPASNEKLITAVTALRLLGPDHRLTTSLVAATPPVDGVVEGDVWLVGGGDPLFSTSAFGTRAYGTYVATPERLADDLVRAEITVIRGRIRTDATRFDATPGAPGWKPSFIPTESPPLSALTVDRAARAPERAAARALRRALLRAGIAVGGVGPAGPAPVDAAVLAAVSGAPARILLEQAGKHSDNFVAEMLLKAVAADETGRGTTAAGARLARAQLRELGVPLEGVVIRDGSGLSYANRTTAASLSALLAAADDDMELGPVLRETLAVAGRDGTLAGRMRTGPAAGVVQAKTGTLNDASALSGYAGACAFSVLVTGTWVDQAAAHALQDRIAQLLARRQADCGG